ncbi:uncharacterized protein [Physcomitrium patens]|uniref:uncharacterized protein n=1 Tax=Physcomitrium patens TaxID=3218 RepID=UPI003CCDE65E
MTVMPQEHANACLLGHGLFFFAFDQIGALPHRPPYMGCCCTTKRRLRPQHHNKHRTALPCTHSRPRAASHTRGRSTLRRFPIVVLIRLLVEKPKFARMLSSVTCRRRRRLERL